MSSRARSFIALHIAVFLFGLSGLFGKWLTLPALVLVFFRTAFAAITLLIGSALRYSHATNAGFSLALLRASFLSGACLAIHWVTFFISIQVSTVAIGVISYSAFPLFVIAGNALFLKTPVTRREVGLALSVLAGVALIVPSWDVGNHLTQGILWGLVSGASFAALTIVNRTRASYAAHEAALGQNAVAAILLAPLAVAYWQTPSTADIGLLLLLGTLCTAYAHTLFIFALQSTSALTASVTAGLESVYGIVFAYLFFAEVPSIQMLTGGCIIIGATLLAQCSEVKHVAPT